jgi:raffinose/stachyose/melibiose transport system substrate-binding protein
MTHHTPLSRRQLLRGAGVGAAGLLLPSSLLAACSSAEGSGGGKGQGKGSASGTIDFWIDIAGEPNQKYFDEKVIAAFEKAKQDIDVKVTYYKGADLRRLIQTALQAQSGPDVVRGPSSTQTLAWSKANVLADLSSYRDQWSWDDKILDWALEAFTTDGKLWALPMRVDTLLLYTNATLLEEKGW